MTAKIFIDGEHGTTGLQIRTRLAGRRDIELLSIPEAERRNAAMREDMLNNADISILCLPDDASREAVSMVAGNNNVRIIDTSTAYRVHQDWAYGFAEMDKEQGEKVRSARLVANPGCYPTGAIALSALAARRRPAAGRLSRQRQRGFRLHRRRQADDRADGRPEPR